MCVPVKHAENFIMCDGQLLSDAKINECGVCYGGNTSRGVDAGKDDCGVCNNVKRPKKLQEKKCPKCGQEKDDCGVCMNPKQEQGRSRWNGKYTFIFKGILWQLDK